MRALRAFLCQRRNVAVLIALLALAMKAFVPAGYMIGSSTKTLTIEVCDGQGGHLLATIQVPLSGKANNNPTGHAKAASDCPYTAITKAFLSTVDTFLITLALLFALTLGVAPVALMTVPRRAFLTPPLRGPPANS